MRTVRISNDFDAWRNAARLLLRARIEPDVVTWSDGSDALLAFDEAAPPLPTATASGRLRVPGRFLDLAEAAACHRDSERWHILYRVLWRLTHGEPGLLEVSVDEDVRRLDAMARAVRHDVHRMHAYVRFRKVQQGETEHYIAWHRPDHFILRRAAPFFRRRFPGMSWSILTPDASAHYDGHAIRFTEGVPRSAAPAADELETLWRTYYGHTFNPARVNLDLLRQHVPARHWATLPEMQDLDALVAEAPRRVEAMVMATRCATTTSAADFLPARLTLPQLREAAKACRGCDLYCNATQTVFGAGPRSAQAMFIGEQPGDQEDRAGEPFVGPAGQLLDEVLAEVGLDRRKLYVTNAVKHFKFEPRGTRRIHAKPNAREIAACKLWLEAEVQVVKPQMIVCLGATAAQALLGPAFRITKERGVVKQHEWAPWLIATYHPSALLRMPDPTLKAQARADFTADLAQAARQLATLSG